MRNFSWGCHIHYLIGLDGEDILEDVDRTGLVGDKPEMDDPAKDVVESMAGKNVEVAG
jgi:hypothetical protein